MSDLRDLVEKATPGPWRHVTGEPGVQYVQDGTGQMDAHVRYEPSDATLIALAPDLALLCADMGEALERIRLIDATSSYKSIYTAPTEMAAETRPLLARLTDLEERIGDVT